jgi:hypothetical protein
VRAGIHRPSVWDPEERVETTISVEIMRSYSVRMDT